MRYIHVSKIIHYRKDQLAGVIPTLVRGDGQTFNKGRNQRKRIKRLRQAAIRRYELRRARAGCAPGQAGLLPFNPPRMPKRKNRKLTEEMLHDLGILRPEGRPDWAKGVQMDLRTMSER